MTVLNQQEVNFKLCIEKPGSNLIYHQLQSLSYSIKKDPPIHELGSMKPLWSTKAKITGTFKCSFHDLEDQLNNEYPTSLIIECENQTQKISNIYIYKTELQSPDGLVCYFTSEVGTDTFTNSNKDKTKQIQIVENCAKQLIWNFK